MPKIFLATPAYGNQVCVTYMRSVLCAVAELGKEGVEFLFFTIGNESLVTRARNMCVAEFLNSDCTHLLFIDSDIEFDVNVIRRVINVNKDVACACYPMKTVNWSAVRSLTKEKIETMSNDDIQGHMMKYNVQFTKDGSFCRPIIDGFMQVDYAATGFMLIKRTVLVKMRKAFPELQYKCCDVAGHLQPHLWAFFDTMIDESKNYLSEDWTFCKRWKQLGGEIWLDLYSPLTHVGSFSFKGVVAQSMNISK